MTGETTRAELLELAHQLFSDDTSDDRKPFLHALLNDPENPWSKP